MLSEYDLKSIWGLFKFLTQSEAKYYCTIEHTIVHQFKKELMRKNIKVINTEELKEMIEKQKKDGDENV